MASLHVCVGAGKGDPIRQLMAESFCNCSRTKSLPSSGEPSLHPQGVGRRVLPGEWRARRSSALGVRLSTDALAHASQVVADPALEAQGSTGAFQEWKRSRGQDFPQSRQ